MSFFLTVSVIFLSPSKVLSATEYLPSPVKLLTGKAWGMTWWINTQLSILSMQIEIKVLHLPLDFRKAQWKTWYMHPFPPAIHFLWKDDSYITVSQNCEANTWQPSGIYFFFPLSSGNQGSYRHHRIHFISLAACAPSVVTLWRLSMTPKHSRHTLLLFSI